MGGNLAVDKAAALLWTEWQLCHGLGGSFPADWAAALLWIGWQLSCGLGGRLPWNTQSPYILQERVKKTLLFLSLW
jgi:hypothetical protein